MVTIKRREFLTATGVGLGAFLVGRNVRLPAASADAFQAGSL